MDCRDPRALVAEVVLKSCYFEFLKLAPISMFCQKSILDIAKPMFPVYLFLIIEPICVPHRTQLHENHLKNTKNPSNLDKLLNFSFSTYLSLSLIIYLQLYLHVVMSLQDTKASPV